jgi:O-antigen/teichoic acid export membrane protein
MKDVKLVAKGGFFSLSGDAFNTLLSYGVLLMAAHFLGAYYIGAFQWVISISSLLSEFADLGTGQGLIYFGPKIEVEKGEEQSLPLFWFVLRFVMGMSVVLGLVLFVAAPWITQSAGKPELTGLLQIMAATFPLSLFWPVVYKYCVARFQIVPGIIYGDFIRPISRVVFLGLLILVGARFTALALTEFLVGLTMLLTGIWLVKHLWGKHLVVGKLDRAQKLEVLHYSLPFLPLNMSRGERVLTIILGFFLPADAIGIFTVALKTAAVSQVILTGLNFVFRPMVTKLYAKKDFTALKQVYKAITRWIFLMTLPLTLFFIGYPNAILGIFGKTFTAGSSVLVIIAIGYLFEYGTSATQVIINMTGKSWLSLFNQICSFVIITVMAAFLVPLYGINGAAVAVALGIIVINLLRLYQSYLIVGFTPYSSYLIRPIAAAVFSILLLAIFFPFGTLLTFWELVFLVVSVLIVYFVLVAIFQIDYDDYQLLRSLLTRQVI